MGPVAFNKKVSVSAHILYKDLRGEGVILNLESESYFGMDEVANRMFSVLSSTGSIEAAFDALSKEYDVEAETLRQDLHEFVQKLVEYGMVSIVD